MDINTQFEAINEIGKLDKIPVLEVNAQVANKPPAYAEAQNAEGTALNLIESFKKRAAVYFCESDHAYANINNARAVLNYNAVAVVNNEELDFDDLTNTQRIAFCMQYDVAIQYDELVKAAASEYIDLADANAAIASICTQNINISKSNFNDAKKLFLKGIVLNNADVEFNTMAEARMFADQEDRVILKANTGAGKSQIVINPIVQEAIKEGRKVLFITSRKSILDAVQINEIADYRKVEAGDEINHLKICINSLRKPAFANFARTAELVVIDEAQQVLRQVITGDMNGMRTQVFNIFNEVVNKAPRLIAADADINDDTVKFYDGASVKVRSNNYDNLIVNLLDGTNAFDEIVKAAEQSQVVVATDSKRHANMLNQAINNAYDRKVMLITADTVGGKEQQDFIANINDRINNYDAVIYTPAMSSGVSIQIENADRKNYGLFVGNIIPSDIVQMIRRDRTATEFHLGIKHTPNTNSLVKAGTNSLLEKMIGQMSRDDQSIKNALKPALVCTLSYLGFKVQVVEGNATDEAKDAVYDAKKIEYEAYVEGVLNSEAASDEEVKQTRHDNQSDLATYFAVERYRVEQFFKTPNITDFDMDIWKRGQIESLVRINDILLCSDPDSLKALCDKRNKHRASNEKDLSFEIFTLMHQVFDTAKINFKAQISEVTEESAAQAIQKAYDNGWNNLGLKFITKRMLNSTQKIKTLNALIKSVCGYGLIRKQKGSGESRFSVYVFDDKKAALIRQFIKDPR